MTQNADGQSHIAYFDERTQASFVWDGASDTIEVCIGGYGEPVDHVILAPEIGRGKFDSTPFRRVMEAFARTVATHAATLPTYGEES